MAPPPALALGGSWESPAPGDPLLDPGEPGLARALQGEWARGSPAAPCTPQEWLTDQMRETRERCGQTLFVFDEAEKLHPGLLEALRPHLQLQAPDSLRAESPRSILLFLR